MALAAPNEGSTQQDPNPNPADQAQATATDDAATQTKDAAETRAQSAAESDARDARVLELLDEGLRPDAVRKALEVATPSEGDATADAGTRETKSGAGTQAPPAGSAQTAAPATPVVYDGLDDKGRQALSQAQLLPPAEVWKALPANVQQVMISQAQQIVAERTRLWQQSQGVKTGDRPRDEHGRFVPLDQTNTVAQGTGAATQSPPAGQQAQAADVRAQGTAPGSAQAPVASAGSEKFKATAAKLKETFGDDIAEPLLEALQLVMDDKPAQAAPQADPAQEYVMRRLIAMEERSAFDQLKETLPNLDTDSAMQEQLRGEARVFAQAKVALGEPFAWEDMLLLAGRARAQPNIRQSAQAALLDKRRTSLQSSPARAATNSNANRALGKAERDQMALDLLDQGKSREEVRAALNG